MGFSIQGVGKIYCKMSENHKIIKIFVASPSGLDEERRAIWGVIEDINRRNSSHWLLQFKPIGWEDTVGGNRRAQDIINRDLETCDYFIGVMADHWGSPPHTREGTEVKYTSGFQEEYELAQEMYRNGKMADIFLFFKKIPEDRLRDPGPSLQKALKFRQQVKDNRRPFYAEFDNIDVFEDKIYDALNKIGWVRTTSNPGSTISAPSDQNSEIFESVSVTHPETNEYYLSEPTREFLNSIKNKSGKSDALTNVEVARLRLISVGLHRNRNDRVYIGAHDANLLFFSRFDLDLSRTEKTTLLTAGLRFMENQNVPFWYWTDGDSERAKELIQSKMVAIDDSIASSALKIAEIFAYRPPPNPENFDQGYWIKRWFDDERTSSLRNFAETYLNKWAEEDDIPALQKIRDGKSGRQAANLDCIIVCIRFRHSESAGIRELNERDPEQISAELQNILKVAIQTQASEVLEGLAKRKADYLRLASIRELVRRDALSEDLAEELSGDNSIEVRLEAIKSLSEKGIRISESQAEQALVFKRNELGLGAVLSGAREPVDRSKFEDYRRHELSRMSLDKLLTMEENDNPFHADALLAACQVFPKETEKLLRELIKDGFEDRFEKRLTGSLKFSLSKGAELAKVSRTKKTITCLNQTREALTILVSQMKERDLTLVQEVIDRHEIQPNKEVFRYFARFGSWDDIERMLKLKGGVEMGLTFFSVNYDSVEDLTQALVKIGSNRFVDLLERIKIPVLLHGVIKSVGNQVFKRLSDEKVLELMGMQDHIVRKATALRCIQLLPKSRISSLLEKYMEKKEQFYNVIHWLDLGSSMPRRYAQKIARRELEKL